jgi:hypothetical protein
MKLQIKKVIFEQDLGEYAKEYAGQFVDVWVNPPRNIINTYDDLNQRMSEKLDQIRQALPKTADEDRTNYQKVLDKVQKWTDDEFAPKLREWYAALLSKGSDQARHWTPDDLIELDQQDPALYDWLRDQTQSLIKEHRDRQKKS